MTDDLKREIETAPYEPLLPIEKKLVAGASRSASPVILAVVNKLYPAAS